MNSSSHDPGQSRTRQPMIDAGLLVGLLMAVVMVQFIDRSTPGVGAEKATVDLVFVIDQQPVMKSLIDAIKANCLEKAQSLASGGSDCRFAVVPFGGKQSRVPLVPLTGDLATFKQRLMAPSDANGVWAASSTEALRQALALDFRVEGSVIVFLISKNPVTDDPEFDTIATEIGEREIVTIVQADPAEKERCLPLYRNGGRFYSMDGTDLTGPNAAPAKLNSKADKQKRTANLLARLSPDKPGKSPEIGQVKGIFALRTALNRTEVIATLGGTTESELAVQDGLNWLARHQADDGHWSEGAKCEPGHACDQLKYNGQGAPVAETGLAILAFQAGGNYYFNNHKYSATVKKGLDWLVAQQKEDGCLFGPVRTWYEHGMATFALAEACAVALANAETPDPRYRSAAERAIKFMEVHQYQRGGWQYALDSDQLGDSSVTGWQMLAIKSAMEAEIDISPGTIEKLTRFFEFVGDPETGRTGYQTRGGGTDLTTAVGLIFQQFILKQPHSPLAEKAIENLKSRAAEIGPSGDYYALYNGTLASFLARGDAWKEWNGVVRDALVKQQAKSDCTRGSWLGSNWLGSYGRTLSTAWAVLSLEVYYRYAAEGDDENK